MTSLSSESVLFDTATYLTFFTSHSLTFETCDVYDTMKCLDRVAEPANKRVMFGVQGILATAQRRYRTGTSSILQMFNLYHQTACQHMVFLGLGMTPFYEEINKKLDQLSSSGLLEYWYQNFLNPKRKRLMKAEEIGPQVLTSRDLLSSMADSIDMQFSRVSR